MLILTLRTDKPEAEIGLYEDDEPLAYKSWQAHRELAETLHKKLDEVLSSQGKELKDLQGIVVFEGPGSFTGLRIGISVANALAYSLQVPIIASSSEDWIAKGNDALKSGQDQKVAIPNYGAEANTTEQRK